MRMRAEIEDRLPKQLRAFGWVKEGNRIRQEFKHPTVKTAGQTPQLLRLPIFDNGNGRKHHVQQP
jgi:hypothetical protein